MGTLYLVSTPIGNLDDITIRAIKTLFSVDYIICEDTRKTGQLMNILESRIRNQELGIKGLDICKKPKLISYYDEIEFKRVPEVIELLNEGKNVALVSNSGTPLISDPGFKLVKECFKRRITIRPIPGSSALLAALTVCGLPSDKFVFLGFLPSSKIKRKKLFEGLFQSFNNIKYAHFTVIFFESPHRLIASLADLKEVFGDIEVVVCRELTKLHEEILKNKISKLLTYFSSPKGEIVVLFTSFHE